MIKPISIPQLQQLSSNAAQIGYTLNINVDIFNYLHTGTISNKAQNLEFLLRQYSNKIVLSFKLFNKEIFNKLPEIFNENFDLLYKGVDEDLKIKNNIEYKFHIEWWLIDQTIITKKDIEQIKQNKNIKILALKQKYLNL